MSSIFNQLLNVKGTVVEDVRIVDSPLRPEPVLEVRVRPRAPLAWPGLRGCWRVELVAAMPRVDCPSVLLQCLFDRFGSVFPQCGLMVFPGVVIVSR